MQRDGERDELEELWLLPSNGPAKDVQLPSPLLNQPAPADGVDGGAPVHQTRPKDRVSRWRQTAVTGRLLLAVTALLLAQLGGGDLVHAGGNYLDLVTGLPSDGLVAADVRAPQAKHGWLVTSGTLITRGGMLSSGEPDGGPPDPARGTTGSAVLRAVTTRANLGDVTVKVSFRIDRLVTTARTPARAWDGLHVFLRYGAPDRLYVVDLNRRDGTVAVKRKTPSVLGPAQEYDVLGTAPARTLPHRWHSADISVWNQDTAVVIVLVLDGTERMRVYDTSDEQLRASGRVGLRGDNTEFDVRRMVVEDADRSDPPPVDPNRPSSATS